MLRPSLSCLPIRHLGSLSGRHIGLGSFNGPRVLFQNGSELRRCHTAPDRKTTALTVISDLKHIRHSPAPALCLGLGGLIPFVVAPSYMILTKTFSADVAFAQLAYGASILSFLGGVRWGLTLPSGSNTAPDWTNLTYSVSPSLVAWVGLMLPAPASAVTVMSGLMGAAYMDLVMPGYPSWFKALRAILTFVAVLSLWTSITCKYLLKNDGKGDQAILAEIEPGNKGST